MQRLGLKAYLVLEKEIFKGFYHIWTWRPSWCSTATILAIYRSPAQGGSTGNLINIGPAASEEKSFEILKIFPIQMYEAHTNT